MAIISRGRVVLSGRVQDLKSRSPHRILELELGEDGHALIERIHGVVTATRDGRRHRLVVDATTDLRGLLAEAQALGELHHFIYTTPSLSQLFREAVA